MLFAVTILWFVCIIFIGIKGNLGSLVPSSGDNNQNGTDTVDIPQSKRLLEQRLRELLSAKQSTKGNSYLQLADVEMPSSRNPSFDQFGNPIESTAGASSSNSRLKERFDELTRPKESTSNAPREVNPETINHPGQNTSRQISEKMRTKCYIAETFKVSKIEWKTHDCQRFALALHQLFSNLCNGAIYQRGVDRNCQKNTTAFR